MELYFRWASEARVIIIQIKRGHQTSHLCLIDHQRKISHQRPPNASHGAPVVVLVVLLAVPLPVPLPALRTAVQAAAPVEAAIAHAAQIRALSKAFLEHFQRNKSCKNRKKQQDPTISCIQPLPRLVRSRAGKRLLQRK